MEFIEKLLNEFTAHDLCGEYKNMVLEAGNHKRKLIDIATDSNGCEYISENAVLLSNIMPLNELSDMFEPYSNGHYISHHRNNKGNGYDSMLICDLVGSIEVKTTLCMVLFSDVIVTVPKNEFVTIYASLNSNLKIEAKENAIVNVNLYDNSVCESIGCGKVNIQINKQER